MVINQLFFVFGEKLLKNKKILKNVANLCTDLFMTFSKRVWFTGLVG